MKRAIGGLAVLLAATAPALVHSAAPRAEQATVLSFGTMAGVDGAFIQEENAIRGIEGDELPWEVGTAQGRLDANGHLIVHVRGLVFADNDAVPPDLRGTNDEACFRAVVSSLTQDEAGRVVVSNQTTECFAADEHGNCDIDAVVRLPDPSVAPLVFVIAGSEPKWFAVTGVESD